MKVAVIGSGAREHSICHLIKKSKLLSKLYIIPGNAGTSNVAENVDIKADDIDKIVEFSVQNKLDLVVVGPELPLSLGIVDRLKAHNIKVFGPTKFAAQLESSKAFTKNICKKYNIPTASYEVFEELLPASEYIKQSKFPIVLKADGLAAGKGVIIAQNKEEALEHLEEIFGGKFGDAGSKVVIEEFLVGREVSFFAICDGTNARYFSSSEDHKKVGEGETGLNTGGMGSFAPSHLIKDPKEIMDNFIYPTLKAMKDLGSEFNGILFAGLIMTQDGPKLLEYNARFGDPETESMLLLLESDLLKLLYEAATGDITNSEIKFSNKTAISVVYAAENYPEKPVYGSVIRNLEKLQSMEDVTLFHAGTKFQDGNVIANGGRVLVISATGNNVQEARAKAYTAIKEIDFKGGFYRKDIGLKQ